MRNEKGRRKDWGPEMEDIIPTRLDQSGGLKGSRGLMKSRAKERDSPLVSGDNQTRRGGIGHHFTSCG